MFLATVLLALLAFYYGGIRRCLRHRQTPRIVLDVAMAAPVLWSALSLHGGTAVVAVAAAAGGYLWVARGGGLPFLWLGGIDPTWRERD